jgi:hypothetical protein
MRPHAGGGDAPPCRHSADRRACPGAAGGTASPACRGSHGWKRGREHSCSARNLRIGYAAAREDWMAFAVGPVAIRLTREPHAAISANSSGDEHASDRRQRWHQPWRAHGDRRAEHDWDGTRLGRNTIGTEHDWDGHRFPSVLSAARSSTVWISPAARLRRVRGTVRIEPRFRPGANDDRTSGSRPESSISPTTVRL